MQPCKSCTCAWFSASNSASDNGSARVCGRVSAPGSPPRPSLRRRACCALRTGPRSPRCCVSPRVRRSRNAVPAGAIRARHGLRRKPHLPGRRRFARHALAAAGAYRQAPRQAVPRGACRILARADRHTRHDGIRHPRAHQGAAGGARGAANQHRQHPVARRRPTQPPLRPWPGCCAPARGLAAGRAAAATFTPSCRAIGSAS